MKHRTLDPEHTEEIRQRVLASAKTLLLQYGYNKTTIRMIVEHSGILTGSIYYLFRNKEDIFQSLFLAVIKTCIERIDDYCADESPAFKYAAVCAVELRKMEQDELIRDAYFAGYNSTLIFEKMVGQFMLLAHHLFDGTVYAIDETVCYQKTLLIKGAMRACIAELYFQRKTDPAASRIAMIELALTLIGVDAKEIEAIQQRILKQDVLWDKIAQQLVEAPIPAG